MNKSLASEIGQLQTRELTLGWLLADIAKLN